MNSMLQLLKLMIMVFRTIVVLMSLKTQSFVK